MPAHDQTNVSRRRGPVVDDGCENPQGARRRIASECEARTVARETRLRGNRRHVLCTRNHLRADDHVDVDSRIRLIGTARKGIEWNADVEVAASPERPDRDERIALVSPRRCRACASRCVNERCIEHEHAPPVDG